MSNTARMTWIVAREGVSVICSRSAARPSKAVGVVPVIGLMMIAACSTNSHQPKKAPTVESSVSTSPSRSTELPVQGQGAAADTITIGVSGVRCLAGKTTVACVTMEHRGMVADGKRTFSFIRTITPEAGVEPGFAPGQHVTNITAGDLVLFDPGNCDEPNTSPATCIPLTINSEITTTNNKAIRIGTISKASPEGLTICADDTVFDIPIPPPAEAGRAVYRPNAGQQLNPGQPITIRDWTFALHDQTLTITYSTGATTVQI
jgi:hypothetical protein